MIQIKNTYSDELEAEYAVYSDSIQIGYYVHHINESVYEAYFCYDSENDEFICSLICDSKDEAETAIIDSI